MARGWGLVAILFLGLANAAGAEKLELKRRFRKGDSVSFRRMTVRRITRKVAQREQRVTMTVGTTFTLQVHEVSRDGTALLKLTIDRQRFEQDGPRGKTEYDSADPPEEVPRGAQHFAAAVGESLFIRAAGDGTIKKVEGLDDMVANAMTKVEPGPLHHLEAIRRQLARNFSKPGIEVRLAGFETRFPGRPVGIGESWSARSDVLGYTPLICEDTWTLQARKGAVATIGIRSKMTPHPTDRTTDSGLAKYTWNLSGHRAGTLEVDEATGWPLRIKTSILLAGTLTVSGVTAWRGESRTGPFRVSIESTAQQLSKGPAKRPLPEF
jgi:hypothetical protein